MVSIDLAKAFDSVPHATLFNACLANGFSLDSLNLLVDIYTDATTILQVNGKKSQPIPIRRGVRQGDPLSPLLFNLVIDQLLRRLDECNLGVKLGNRRLAAVGYADDIILCGETIDEVHNLVAVTNQVLCSLGLKVNWEKSFCYGGSIAGLTQRSSFKYLGAKIDPSGDSRMTPEELIDMVKRLDRAVLRGNQKIYFLRFHLLPSIFHRLTHEKVTATTLRKMTTSVRNFVRKWAKLPAFTCSSFIHLAIRNGGLGIVNLRWKLPEMIRARMVRLQKCRAWYVQHVVRSTWYRTELYRIDDLCPLEGSESWSIRDMALANPGHLAFPIGAARFSNRHLTGGGFVEGKKFYRFAQMRCSADNGNTRRARPPPICTKCNSGQLATLQHTLCQCPDNAANIRKRHDLVLEQIIAHCKRKNLVFLKEPTLRCGKRPDLVVSLQNGTNLCLDVTVVFELTSTSLQRAAKEKEDKYEPHLAEINGFMAHGNATQVHGLAFGARGSISAKSLNILEILLEMPRWRIEKILNSIITISLDLYEHCPLASRASANLFPI